MGHDWKSKGPRPASVLDRETLVVIIRILSSVSKGSGLARRIKS